jgi:hypothetical protein
VLTTVLLFSFFRPDQAVFWALVNIPLYLFHQTEEHLWPGGFKDYINRVVYGLPQGVETLTDLKVFWINILMVWFAFAVFGTLVAFNIGFGLTLIIFSTVNCVTHIIEGFKRRRWNPGLILASLQFLLSVYAAWFVTMNGLTWGLWWWAGSLVFAVLAHLLLFRLVMSKTSAASLGVSQHKNQVNKKDNP